MEQNDEHALKCVIDHVEELCNKFNQLRPDDDGKERTNLDLSTIKIIDELQMSAVEHAKHEVMLVTCLDDCLTRLIDHCEKVLQSSDATDRLKSFRSEMKKLFTDKMSSFITRGQEPKPLEIPIEPPVDPSRSAGKTDAERTKTPSEEAQKPGHASERSDRVNVMNTTQLKNLRQQLAAPVVKKKDSSTSDDTKATRTPSPPTEHVAEDDDRSQRIWTEETLAVAKLLPEPAPEFRTPTIPVKKLRTKIKQPESERDTNAIRTSTQAVDQHETSLEQADFLGMADPPTLHEVMRQQRSLSPGRPIELRQTSIRERTAEKVRRDRECPNSWSHFFQHIGSGILIGIGGLVVMMIVSIFASSLIRLYSDKPMFGGGGVLTVVEQIVCSLLNTFCEHYDFFCIDYCVSGFEREKWQSNR